MPPKSSRKKRVAVPLAHPAQTSSQEQDAHPAVEDTNAKIPQRLQDLLFGGERIDTVVSDAVLGSMRRGKLRGLVAPRNIDFLMTEAWVNGERMLLVNQDLLSKESAKSTEPGARANTSSVNIIDYLELHEQPSSDPEKSKMDFSDEATLLLGAAFCSVKMPTKEERQRLGDWLGVATSRITLWFNNERLKRSKWLRTIILPILTKHGVPLREDSIPPTAVSSECVQAVQAEVDSRRARLLISGTYFCASSGGVKRSRMVDRGTGEIDNEKIMVAYVILAGELDRNSFDIRAQEHTTKRKLKGGSKVPESATRKRRRISPSSNDSSRISSGVKSVSSSPTLSIPELPEADFEVILAGSTLLSMRKSHSDVILAAKILYGLAARRSD